MRTSEGDNAWLAILAWAVAYDVWAIRTCRETLSQSFARALDAPTRRRVTAVVWVGLVVHLFTGKSRRG